MLRVWKFVFLVVLYRGVSEAADCKRAGKFPYDELPNCRGLTTCTPIGTGGFFYSYNLLCPVTFIFNHLDQQCSNSTSYKCFPDYNCTTVGNFDYTDNENCTSYIACVNGLSGIVTARLIDCPVDKVFSPDIGRCVASIEYTCLRKIISTTTTSSDMVTEMLFIYNNTESVTKVSNEEFPYVPSSSAFLCFSFRILFLSVLIVNLVCAKAL